MKGTVNYVSFSQNPKSVEPRRLKSVLPFERESSKESKKRYQALLVSASRSTLCHSVYGNTSTVIFSTLLISISVLPKWMKLSTKDCIVRFGQDSEKAFIQALKRKRLII